MTTDLQRIEILKKVEKGELSIEVAARLLGEVDQQIYQQIDITPVSLIEGPEINDEPSREIHKKPEWAFVFWLGPLMLGIILTSFSSAWLYESYQVFGLGFRFWLTWIPFLIGVFLIYLGWTLQRARWIHIHIRQPKGESPERIVLGFPLPFRFLGIVFHMFQHKMPPSARNTDIIGMINAVDDNIKNDDPIYVHVDDKDGTKVEIYIG
jgi:hypothetical protein